MAAEADEDSEMNFVRKHALVQAEVRRREGGREGRRGKRGMGGRRGEWEGEERVRGEEERRDGEEGRRDGEEGRRDVEEGKRTHSSKALLESVSNSPSFLPPSLPPSFLPSPSGTWRLRP